MNFRIGKAGIFMSAIASYYDSEGRSYENEELRVDLAFSSDRAKAIFLALEQKANEIEKDYGSELIWYKPEEGRYRIQIARKVVLRDESDWPNQHQWLMENLEQMVKVFRDRIQAL